MRSGLQQLARSAGSPTSSTSTTCGSSFRGFASRLLRTEWFAHALSVVQHRSLYYDAAYDSSNTSVCEERGGGGPTSARVRIGFSVKDGLLLHRARSDVKGQPRHVPSVGLPTFPTSARAYNSRACASISLSRGFGHRGFHVSTPRLAAKKDYYELLGVDKGASAAEIKK
eukprot:7183898-Pyramimonas_sp.AAC.1